MKLMIVEDNENLLQSLQILLDGDSGIVIVGAFPNAELALAAIHHCSPDILLSDLGLPGMTGIELIKEVKKQLPAVESIAYTMYEDRDSVFSALKAGASGYILKGCPPRELVEALHSLHKGGAPMSPKIARKVISEFRENSHNDENIVLSRKETEILRLIEEAMSYKAISDKLFISPHTVHTHIKHIYEKLQAKDRREALLNARKQGII